MKNNNGQPLTDTMLTGEELERLSRELADRVPGTLAAPDIFLHPVADARKKEPAGSDRRSGTSRRRRTFYTGN